MSDTYEITKLQARVLELERALRDALGHSNCYCEQCKEIAKKHWRTQSDGELMAIGRPERG